MADIKENWFHDVLLLTGSWRIMHVSSIDSSRIGTAPEEPPASGTYAKIGLIDDASLLQERAWQTVNHKLIQIANYYRMFRDLTPRTAINTLCIRKIFLPPPDIPFYLLY